MACWARKARPRAVAWWSGTWVSVACCCSGACFCDACSYVASEADSADELGGEAGCASGVAFPSEDGCSGELVGSAGEEYG